MTKLMQHNNRFDHVQGFTLIELMVTMVLSLFLMAGAILMYLSVQSTYDDVERMSRMQENIRFASDYLVRDVRNAGFKDELSLTIGEEQTIEEAFVQLSESGTDLRVRYAGRGHCQQQFDNYQVVQNRYWLDAATGELRCTGSTAPDFDDSGAGMALVGGLTGLSFELHMADETTTTLDTTCSDPDHPTFAGIELDERCLGVAIGIEFEAMRDLDDAAGQTIERRFVELFATFRNAAIQHVYGELFDD